MIVQVLCPLEVREFLDQLFLTETGEADGEFYVVARTLSSEDQTASVLFMCDVGAGNKSRIADRFLWLLIMNFRGPGRL